MKYVSHDIFNHENFGRPIELRNDLLLQPYFFLYRLALLWYHTIVRPFFALDGYNLQAGVKAASALMEEAQCDYSQSALFLFFEGRIKRLEVT